MFGGYEGRSREESLTLLKEFLGAYGPPERALKSLRGPMPQEQLAQQAGVSQPLISGIEAGTKDLTPGVAGNIAEVLGIPAGALQTAVRLGQLKAALEGGQTNGQPLTLQIVEVLALVEAAQRDRERLKELEQKEAAPKVATKSKQGGKTRDQWGRRIKGAELLGLSTKSKQEPERIERDAFGRNRSKRDGRTG